MSNRKDNTMKKITTVSDAQVGDQFYCDTYPCPDQDETVTIEEAGTFKEGSEPGQVACPTCGEDME